MSTVCDIQKFIPCTVLKVLACFKLNRAVFPNFLVRGSLGTDGRIILEWTLKIRCEGLGWINVAQDRDKWQAVSNTVRNFHISKNARECLE